LGLSKLKTPSFVYKFFHGLKKGSVSMDSRGQHLIVDAYECQHDILNDAERLKEVLIKAIDL
jgi:S-adenosylmethionine/arginine decarboxylase-like enzyme